MLTISWDQKKLDRPETINSLYDDNGVITRQHTKILWLSKSWYENLYLYKSIQPNIEKVKKNIDNTII